MYVIVSFDAPSEKLHEANREIKKNLFLILKLTAGLERSIYISSTADCTLLIFLLVCIIV